MANTARIFPPLSLLLLILLAISLSALPFANSYTLAWAYGERHIGDTAAAIAPEDDTGTNSQESVHGISSRKERDYNTSAENLVEVCKTDKACGRGSYCDRHYGICFEHKTSMLPCRRDGHCERGLECRFGTCQIALEMGEVGARCKNDKDCGDNMCCAKQHGESICKARLPLNAKCYVPEGGVNYMIDSICPCVDGLTCMKLETQEVREEEFVWQFWTDYDHMRCAPIHVEQTTQ